MDKKKYKIIKVLNNNVILARELSANRELVLVGRGIGFNCKTKQIVELSPDEIERSYVDENTRNEFFQILNDLDSKVMGVSEEIIALAENELGSLNPHIHIALTDHIGFALDRLKEGLNLNNPFLDEIRILYSKEYKVGVKAARMISERLGINIPESEIAFIAMHIHAARQNKKVSETVKYTTLIKELVQIVEKELNIKINISDLSYSRLVNHLRFSINRMEKGEVIENPLSGKIKEEFSDSYKVAKKLGKHMQKYINTTVSEDELGYITLHIHRLKSSLTRN